MERPRVSVVIPVLNGRSVMTRCLDALLDQTYPADLLEIIVVDNGSTDGTLELLEDRAVTVLSVTDVRSPYAARNEGVRHAAGEVVAFTDADCQPAREWVERGVAPIAAGAADLVGGEIRYSLGAHPGMAERMDATINCEMKNSIQRRGVAKTGNLFAHRRVVESVGPFRSDIRSGGDVAWTGAATAAGFRMVYEPGAEVWKQPRGLDALLRKQRRVGRGHVRVWREQGVPTARILARALGSFLPRSPGKYRRLARERRVAVPRWAPGFWFTGWLATIWTGIGRLEGILGNDD